MLTPAEKLLRKSLVTSGMSASEWESFDVALKDRAFWVSRVESLKFVAACHDNIADLLKTAQNDDGATISRAEVISNIMRAAREAGIASGSTSITDPGSVARANVIVDTNAGLAAGYAQAEQANTYGARLAFPAQELVRVEDRERPRDWRSKWVSKGGHLFDSRMIALKDDPIWISISRFGCPYPPFDYNSGMGVEDVSYDEAVQLGVIPKDYQPPEKSPIESFNDGLSAELKIERTDDPKLIELQRTFGDQIGWNPSTKTISWQGNIIQDLLNDAKQTKGVTKGRKKVSLGEPSDMVSTTLFGPKDQQPKELPQLRVPASSLWKVYRDHVDHEKDERSIRMTEKELELMGRVWRKPDGIYKGDEDRWIAYRQSFDGNRYLLVFSKDNKGGLVFHSFYKKNMNAGAESERN